MTEQENHKLIQDAFAALNARDLDAYCNLLDDSYVWENDAFPSPMRGKEGARQAMSMYFAAFPDLHLHVERVISSPAGDLLVDCWRATGTHQGEFLGLAPTRRSVESRGCTVSEVRNGRITHSTTYSDQLSLTRQLTEPPKAAAAS
jgi:steroid delta-isomerase-like uncharacterized protein